MARTDDARFWVLPTEPSPVRLMNTIWADSTGIRDDLATPADLRAWLAAVGVTKTSPTVTPEDLERARSLRDAMRRLAAHATSDTRVLAASAMTDLDQAIAAVNTVAAVRPSPRLTLSDGQLALADLKPVSAQAGLAHVANQAIELFSDPSNSGLGACHAPGCVLYFVRTHPRREWCSDACGNRARAARHYKRVRAARST